MKKYAILFLFCLQTALVAAGVLAEKVYFVAGVVSDNATGETLAGVEIQVQGTANVFYSDLDGRFSLADLPEGETTLILRYPMYENKSVTVNVNSAGTNTFGEYQLTVQLQAR